MCVVWSWLVQASNWFLSLCSKVLLLACTHDIKGCQNFTDAAMFMCFPSALNLGQFIEAMTPKLINRDEDSEIRQTFMAFDTHCKFFFNLVPLCWYLYMFGLSCCWFLFLFLLYSLLFFSFFFFFFFLYRFANGLGRFVQRRNVLCLSKIRVKHTKS